MIKPAVFEGILELEDVDDGGQARIARLDDDREPDLFIRFQSWEDEISEYEEPKHLRFKDFEGKKVKITVEVIENA